MCRQSEIGGTKERRRTLNERARRGSNGSRVEEETTRFPTLNGVPCRRYAGNLSVTNFFHLLKTERSGWKIYSKTFMGQLAGPA